MELRDRLLGPITKRDEASDYIAVDFGDLVRKLVLFEEIILESNGLQEFPLLVQKFGFAGVKELLDSGLIRRIDANVMTFGQTGQLTELESRERKGALPLGSYSFGVVRATDASQKDLLHKGLAAVNEVPGLTFKQSKILRKLIGERLVTLPRDAGVDAGAQLKTDLVTNVPLLKVAVASAARDLAQPIDPLDFDLRVEPIDDDDYRTETDLGERLGLDPTAVHKIVERGLLGVAGLNQRIESMRRYQAVTGFRTHELPLFDEKLGFLARQLDPQAHTERFERVLELAGMPDVDSDPASHDVDLGRLLEIVRTAEAQEFREWLRGVDDLDDAEVRRQVDRLRNLIRGAVHSDAGKAVRFATTTGLGFVPIVGVPLGIGASVLDAFVLDKVIPEPGPTAFLGSLYRTIFNP